MISRIVASSRVCFAAFVNGAGGRLLEDGDLQAGFTPQAGERSLFNSVLYEATETLERSLGAVEKLYAGAGAHAWLVWVPPGDRAAGGLLERRGYSFDGEPAAMALELDRLGPAPARFAGVEVEEEDDAVALARLNDLAYGHRGDFERVTGPGGDAGRRYFARVGGRRASSLAIYDAAGDAYVAWVATAPWAQRRGLASGVLHRALLDARERGMTSSSLQASRAGATVYARLGYEVVGSFSLWEKRV